MKKTPWEKWEVDFLREVAATMPVEVIAEKLERTEKAVMAKATRIGADIVSRLRGRRWTRAEVSLFGKFLRRRNSNCNLPLNLFSKSYAIQAKKTR